MSDDNKAFGVLVQVVSPFVRYGDNLATQKAVAYTVLHGHELEAGHSKIEEATKKRAGEPTYRELKRQAEKVGFVSQPEQQPAALQRAQTRAVHCPVEDALFQQFATLREMMAHTDAEFFGPDIQAISEILQRHGHSVPGDSQPARGFRPSGVRRLMARRRV